MMARPSVRALTEWRLLLGTIGTKPVRAIYVIADRFVDLFLRVKVLMNDQLVASGWYEGLIQLLNSEDRPQMIFTLHN